MGRLVAREGAVGMALAEIEFEVVGIAELVKVVGRLEEANSGICDPFGTNDILVLFPVNVGMPDLTRLDVRVGRKGCAAMFGKSEDEGGEFSTLSVTISS